MGSQYVASRILQTEVGLRANLEVSNVNNSSASICSIQRCNGRTGWGMISSSGISGIIMDIRYVPSSPLL